MPPTLRSWFTSALLLFVATASHASPVLKFLFLGDNGQHQPGTRLRALAPTLMSRGIQLVYTEDPASLTLENLRRYDGLLIYANIDELAPEQEKALLGYVRQGGGLFALHSAAYCFRNSDAYVALVGAQFKSHQTGTVRTRIVAPNNPVMKGFTPFESWDETDVHTRHNTKDRVVLEQREDEPWTWLRTEGKGRVFYTAWGHDDRTWSNPGFHDLVERGLRYIAGQTLPDALSNRPKVAPFELFNQAGIPYYTPGQRSQGDGPWPQMPKPLSPAESQQHLVVPAGFEVQLVASEPQIRKPIAMNWDERGRLWLAETLDYPNTLLDAGKAGRDRLLICEDTDQDGKMDKFTVFADGLNIPTGFTFSKGGVILLQAPNTLFLKDTDGDDRADVREILFSGWGRTDTHAGPNNLVYGFDNWIWGMLGYSGFTGSVGGEGFSFRQGFYRFRPDGSQLEFLRATNNNTWGLGFTEDGLAFGSTANNNPSVYLPIPNRYYPPAGLDAKTLGGIADTSRFVPLTGRVRQVDVHWGYTAAAGHAFYTARAYPREYWNRIAFVAEPTGHLVGQFNVEASGANFRSKSPTNLIASDDEWFAPIMAEVGPDGAVWIIDWYNYIIQHNPTPKGFVKGSGNAYNNDLRDQRYGRIYRIVWKGEKPASTSKPGAVPFTLAGATPTQLVAALKNDNLLWRRHAQRLLVERGRKDIAPALLALVADKSVDELGLNVGAIHALWTLHGLGAIDALPDVIAAATAALDHPSASVRRTAITVLPKTAATVAAVLKDRLLDDSDAQVRLAALLALASGPASPAAGKAIYASLDRANLTLDQWTVDGAKLAASTQRSSFLGSATNEHVAQARAMMARTSLPTVTLETFEQSSLGAPTDWQTIQTTGTATVSVVEGGNKSDRALEINAAGDGADVSVTRKFKVKRKTRYDLSAYIKTNKVVPSARGLGALILIPEVQLPRLAITPGIKNSVDWVRARLPFESGDLDEVTLSCVLGSGAPATGTVWFDDFTLTDLGPSDETIADPLTVVIAHVLEQNAGRRAGADSESDTGVVVVKLGVVPDAMKYDQAELTIKAGEKVRFVLQNNDHMQHNALILRPGRLDAVGALADAMLTDPQALSKNYVPESPDVLFSIPLVNPGESFGLSFTAPNKPGRYPIICTFPGHWRMMQSVLVVR